MADPDRLACLSVCSGVGGIELGLSLVLPGLRTVGYVEWDAYAAAVLLARMEDEALEPAPVWCGDLRDLDASVFRGVDLVTAGFPCQPWSSAGKRRGTDDERWIWPDIARIVRDVGPQLLLLENVPGLLAGGLGHVLGDLAALGFDAEWGCFRAADVGAPHRRERVFILAYRDGGGGEGTGLPARRWEEGRGAAVPNWAGPHVGYAGLDNHPGEGVGAQAGREIAIRSPSEPCGPGGPHVADAGRIGSAGRGEPESVERPAGEAAGEAPQRERSGDTAGDGSETVADAGGSRRTEGQRSGAGEAKRRITGWSSPAVADADLGVFPPGPDDHDGWGRWLAAGGPPPAVRRGADGLAARLDRLRCCGNGVVPQQVALAFAVLARRAGVW